MPSEGRKQHTHSVRCLRRPLTLTALAALASLSACNMRPSPRTVSVHALESAMCVEPAARRRAVVADADALGELCLPLGRRLGLIQIHTARQWEHLRRLAPEIGAPPDFRRGMVIGVASRVGLPVDGTWPIHIDLVRVYEGAGFAAASFQGGTFLPDGTTYIETAQVEGLHALLMVEVNGTRFYP